DPLLPKQMRYQAALRPDKTAIIACEATHSDDRCAEKCHRPCNPDLTRYKEGMLTPIQQAITLLGDTLLAVGRGMRRGWQFRAQDFARSLADASARALIIVLVVNVLVGAIIAFVGAVQLMKFGAGICVADLVAIAISREMAAVITAVVMCGRTGAAFAAELATMQTNEEIDALTVLGLN